jgi:dienelactone hydrolase
MPPGTKRVLKIAVAAVVLVHVAIGIALAGVRYGWWVEKLEPAEISALLRPNDAVFVPEGEGPFPTVLLFHGCGGVRIAMSQWAELFRDAGYAAIVVDSMKGRGLESQDVCSGRALLGSERAGDVIASLADAKQLPFVDPEQIVLAGWSHGGWSIMDLMAMDPPKELPHNLASLPDGGLEGIAGIVVIYPYCGFGARASAWPRSVPAFFVLAGADSVANPAPCLAVADTLSSRGHAVQVKVYDGIDHAFDQPDLPSGSHLVYEPNQTVDARQQVMAFLGKIAR